MSDVQANGWTLQQFMGATKAEIADGMTKSALESAAKKDSEAMGGWMANAGGGGVRTELAGHVAGFLQGGVDDVFAGVWSRCTALQASAQSTRGKPGVTEVVALADHDFTYSMAPEVEIVVAGVRMGSFKFRVELTCKVKALELQVRDGGVAAVLAGECEGSAAILLAGAPLWQRKMTPVKLPGTVKWDPPLLLASKATGGAPVA